MSARKLEAVRKEMQALSLEISKLKDQKAELSLREGPRIPEQRYEVETEIKRKETELISLEETARGLSLRLKKLPMLRLKIKDMEKRAKDLNTRGLKALGLLEKHRQKVKQVVDNLHEITRQFRRLQAVANEIKQEVDPEEMPDVSTKRSFDPPTNAVYFAENRSVVTKW